MKIVFFGTSDFAEVILKELLKSPHEVMMVVTQPDRKKGRALKLEPSPVKALAAAEDIRIMQPEDASSGPAVDLLRKLGADLFVVVAFGQILKYDVLSIPKIYSINIHSSLLPKYRGAAPVNWAIMNGEDRTGVSIIKMNEEMDAGPVILKKDIPIGPEDTAITINEKLSDIGSKLMLEAIGLIEAKKETFAKQDEGEATFAPRLRKDNGLIDWNKSALKISNMVRGLMPWPSAYTFLEGKLLKIWKAETYESPAERLAKPGEVVNILKGEGMVVKAGSGCLLVRYMQLEGKKILDTDAFLRGHPIQKGTILNSLHK
jgi:methionyl-tRNA formyltransferase